MQSLAELMQDSPRSSPADDPGRIAALRAYGILDTPPEREFDDIVQMAAQACGTPMAHINLIDADRQWVKAAVGHDAREMPLDFGFCTRAVAGDDILVLDRLDADARTASNPLVRGTPHLRFYAGVPLVTPDGHAIGTLCVLDVVPRTLTDEQVFILKALARTAMAHLERRRSDAALRLSEERYRSLYRSIDTGFCVIQVEFEGDRPVDYRFVEVNPAFEMQTGLSGIVGERVRDVIPDNERHWYETYGSVALTGRPVRLEEPVAALGRWYDVHAYRIDEPGARKVAVLFNDVTVRRETEMAIRSREADLRLVADSLPVLIAFVDADLVYQFANAAYKDWLGLPHDEVVGRPMAELMSPDEFAARKPFLHRTLDGEAVRLERDWIMPDGRVRTADIRYMPRLCDGRVEGIHIFAHDVTERMRAEGALHSRAEVLEATVAAQGRDRDRVWTLSPILKFVAGPDGIVQMVNPSWTRTLALSEEDTLGRDLADLVAPGDAEAARLFLDGCTSSRSAREVELSMSSPNGERRILWTVVPEDGHLYGFGRDITEQRHAEEALRQSQKLEAVGQLTGGVAHDFNNLLTIIRSSVDFLRRPDLPEERKRRYLDAVSETVDRAAKLTSQLLAFARRQALRPEVFEVNDRLRAVSEMLDSVTGARIRVVTDLPGVACHVRADISQFETALINMAVNARDAMDGEGVLTLRLEGGRKLPPIRSHAGSDEAFAAVSVTDSGSGIPEADLARIFEPFYTTKAVGRGTGLGLSQVIGFAKQSGGDVSVESAVGSGTTFTLYLPMVEPAREAGADGNEGRADTEGESLCILVVEDNLDVGRFCTQILEDLGHSPVWAQTAEEALARVAEAPARFDAVFSDVVMPGIGGIELAKRLRTDRPDLPVVLTSGYSHVLARDDAHGFELLRKPYSAEQLGRVLRATRARRRVP